MDDGDVGVIERRQQLGLALEAGHALRVVCHSRQKHLQCDVALKDSVACAINFAHTARPERRKDFVRTQASSWRQGYDR